MMLIPLNDDYVGDKENRSCPLMVLAVILVLASMHILPSIWQIVLNQERHYAEA